VAFLPTNVPLGIDFSEDPLLQGRLFSSQDTQLSRLGTVNFHQIPINRAKGCPFQNLQRDGKMQTQVFKGRANYEPNSLAESGEIAGPRSDPVGGFESFALPVQESKVRVRSKSFSDHYSHARLFYRSQTEIERAHIASALVFELSKVSLEHVQQRILGNLQNVDQSLAERVANGLNMLLPKKNKAAMEPEDMSPSPGLRNVGKYPDTLQGRFVAILVTDGADKKVISSLRKTVEGEGAAIKIVAPRVGGVTLSDDSKLAADGQLAGSSSVLFDAVALVLSSDGARQLANDSAAVDFVKNAFVHLKAIGFVPDAKALLATSGIEIDKAVVDLAADGDEFVKQARTRLWEREPKVRLLA